MSETRNVRVTYGGHMPQDDRPAISIETPFNGEFVEDLKRAVPWGERGWDAEEKVWWVGADYADRALELVIHHYGETLIVHEDGSEEYRDSHGTQATQERLF